MDFSFIRSTRFWALIFGSAGTVLMDSSFSTDPWYLSLGKFLGLVGAGFIGIKTIDRAVDASANAKVEAAEAANK